MRSTPTTAKRSRAARGFTLIELMIALVLGLIVIGGSLALFVGQRVTNRQAGDMSNLQNEGRIALDALVRDIRAAGDTGCKTSNTNRIINTAQIFAPENAGVFGFAGGSDFTQGRSAANSNFALPGATKVATFAPSSSPVLALSGIYGMIAPLKTPTTGNSTEDLTLTGKQDIKAGDVLTISDCVSTSFFEVTGASPDTSTTTIAHAQAASTSMGGGNNSDGLGAVYGAGATVGRLDFIWWFIGKDVNIDGGKKASGLFRYSARNDSLQLVSNRVESLALTYNGNAATTSINAAGSAWQAPTSVSVKMTLKSEKPSNANYTSIELPLETTVSVRN